MEARGFKTYRDWYHQVLHTATNDETIDDLVVSATLYLEEGIVGQCIVSDADGGGRSWKGWVGLENGEMKKD